jgi:hypothetical protein
VERPCIRYEAKAGGAARARRQRLGQGCERSAARACPQHEQAGADRARGTTDAVQVTVFDRRQHGVAGEDKVDHRDRASEVLDSGGIAVVNDGCRTSFHGLQRATHQVRRLDA